MSRGYNATSKNYNDSLDIHRYFVANSIPENTINIEAN
jgi:hypothetical protein